MEEWKDIPNYNGDYQVSNFGRVKSFKRNSIKIMQGGLSNKYPNITLCKQGKTKTFLIHRLVLLCFLGDSELQVNHLDGDKTNNKLTNLEYCTPSANLNHAAKSGLLNPTKGTKNPQAKLTDADVFFIKEAAKNKTHKQKELAEIYNVSRATISMINSGRLWKHLN